MKEAESVDTQSTQLLESERIFTSSYPVQLMHPSQTGYDSRVIHPRYYNHFSIRQFPVPFQKRKLAIGVTSAARGEGKTLVAANLAVSLAHGYRHRTVLIDLSISNPQMHRIFHLNQGPGVAEAFRHEQLELSATAFPNLFVLPAGFDLTEKESFQNRVLVSELIESLKPYFDFIIVDMNSVFPLEYFPTVLAGELDAILPVVDATNTTKGALRRMSRHLNRTSMMGYIMNRIREGV